MGVLSNSDTLDRARLARIRARLDGEFAEFDAGIDAILAEVEWRRSLRQSAMGTRQSFADPNCRLPIAEDRLTQNP